MPIKRNGFGNGSGKHGVSQKTKLHVLTVTVTAGPYPNMTIAKTAKANAGKIQNTQTGTIKKTAKGYTFPIIQKFGAKNRAEEDKFIRMIHSHRVKKGVPDNHVKIKSKIMRV